MKLSPPPSHWMDLARFRCGPFSLPGESIVQSQFPLAETAINFQDHEHSRCLFQGTGKQQVKAPMAPGYSFLAIPGCAPGHGRTAHSQLPLQPVNAQHPSFLHAQVAGYCRVPYEDDGTVVRTHAEHWGTEHGSPVCHAAMHGSRHRLCIRLHRAARACYQLSLLELRRALKVETQLADWLIKVPRECGKGPTGTAQNADSAAGRRGPENGRRHRQPTAGPVRPMPWAVHRAGRR